MNHFDADTEEDQRPSKSEIKREMHALQALGEELTKLPAKELDALIDNERLLKAIHEMSRIKSNEARRRQLQFIGKLMRGIDASALSEAIAQRHNTKQQDNDAFHRLEQVRDELISGAIDVNDALTAEFPGADRQRIRQLVLQARREQKDARPPAASRKLLRYLRDETEHQA